MRALRGPNYYSKHPVIFMKLDIQELEIRPTDSVPNFKENLNAMIPSLYEHTCSPGIIGGFYERLVRGTWAGHVVEHVAIELQCLIGHEVTFGKTFSTDEYGVYNVVYRYLDESTGLRAGEMAVDIIGKLFNGIISAVEPFICKLRETSEWSMLGPSTQSIVDEASKRGIPHIRLNQDSYVQLGLGVYQRKIQATMMDNTSALGVEIADDKLRTKNLLSSIGIPISEGLAVRNLDEALEAAQTIGYPVVVKPLSGNHGRGITTNINYPHEIKIAFEKAEEVCGTCIVEKYLEGHDFRMLVIDGKFVAAAMREPAFIIGNGRDTIDDLINELNKDPERGTGHEKNLTKVKFDYTTKRLLENKNLTLSSILEDGKKLYIKSTANISAGGTARDVTDMVHPLNILMAERISRIIGLNVMGIDIVAKSIEQPLKSGRDGVLEVNAAPGFRMHLNPSEGKKRNIASNIIDMLFPPGSKHSIFLLII